MDPTLIILGIGFVVWLVSTIYKNAEEAKKRTEQAAVPRQSRPATTEIDKFLEEIQRRRMQQQSGMIRQAPPAAPPVAPRAKPAVLATPLEPSRPAIPRALPARPAPRPIPARPVELVRPNRAAIPAILVAEPAVAPLEMPFAVDVIEAVPATMTTPQRTTAGRGGSPQLAEIIRVLHSTKGIRQALVSSLILGPPRCKGGRTRGF